MIASVKLFGMKLFDEDLWELLFKFGLDLLVLFVLIRVIYYPIHRKKDYLFTYFLFNILIFFLCVLLNNVKLSIGFAFGLFAIFTRIITTPLHRHIESFQKLHRLRGKGTLIMKIVFQRCERCLRLRRL